MDLLEVKNISKTYGTGEATVHALKDATFSVPKGEFVAVVGESGSGKSTLLNMIGALDTPTSGKVFIDSILARWYRENRVRRTIKSSRWSSGHPLNGFAFPTPMSH